MPRSSRSLEAILGPYYQRAGRPILSKYQDAPKCHFLSAAGKLLLPVESDTTLARDIAAAADRTDRQLKKQARQERGMPRKSLGGVAKRAAPSADLQDSQKQ